MEMRFNKLKKGIWSLFLLLFCFLLLNNQGFCQEKSVEETAVEEQTTIEEIPVRQESVTIIKNDVNAAEKYRIAAGDILSISIYDEPDMTQAEISVRPDGYATIYPIGEVFVESFTISELTEVLKQRFAEYINDPRISVNIKDFNPASIYIFGAVEKPGTYQQMTTLSKQFADSKNPSVRTDLTLINVINNAGGISIDADLSKIVITRQDKQQKKVDLWKFIKDGDISQNIKLKTGDVIFVPKLDTITINDEDFKLITRMGLFPSAFPVRVIGEVRTGGIYNIKGDSPYLNSAVANASGYTLEAKKSIVVVHRKSGDDKLARIYVDPFQQDFVLRPNDIVEVKKRTFMKFVYGMDYLSRIISPFNSLSGVGNSWLDLINSRRRYYTRY